MKKQLSILAVSLGLLALPLGTFAYQSQDTSTMQDKKDDHMNHDTMSSDTMSHDKMSKKKHKKGDKMDHGTMSDTTSTKDSTSR